MCSLPNKCEQRSNGIAIHGEAAMLPARAYAGGSRAGKMLLRFLRGAARDAKQVGRLGKSGIWHLGTEL
jgi:hypothetical protein